MMITDALKLNLQERMESIPFVKKVGVIITDSGALNAGCALPLHADNMNHIGTSHAGALFTLAETAGGVLLASLIDLKQYLLVVRSFSVDYLKPPLGALHCTATISEQHCNDFLKELKKNGRSNIAVEIPVVNDEHTVATGHGVYHARRRED